jgi:hypothetical protein
VWVVVCFVATFSTAFAASPKSAKKNFNTKSSSKKVTHKERTSGATPAQKPPKRKHRPKLDLTFSASTTARKYRAQSAGSKELNNRQLRTYNRTDITDTFNSVPGLYLSQHTGKGKAHQYFLRGFDAVHGSELEIRVAGIPINEVSNVHGQGYADLHFLIPDVILHLRALKGPFLGHQGDFAISGSLEMDLGLEERGFQVQVQGGSFSRRGLQLLWGPGGMNKHTFVAVQLGASDGFGPERGWLEGKGMAQVSFRWRRFQFRLLMGAHFGQFSSAGVLPESSLKPDQSNFYQAQQTGLGGHSGRFLAQAEVRWRSGWTRFLWNAYVVTRDLRLQENFTGSLLFPQGDTFEQRHDFTQVGGIGRWQREFEWLGRMQKLSAGLELRVDRMQQSQYRLTSKGQRHTTEIDADVEGYQLAAWLGLRLRWSRLEWNTALRATLLGLLVESRTRDDIRGPSREGAGLHLAPRTTLQWRVNARAKFFLSYGLGFRSAQARSLRDGETVPFQEAHNAEFGFRLKQSRLWQFSLALFGIYVGQELIFDHATATNLYAGASWRFGGEMDVRLRLFAPGLWLETSVTYTEGRFATDGQAVPFAPRLVLRAGLTWRGSASRGFWRWMTALRANLLGPRPLPLGFETDTIFLLNAVAQVTVARFVFVRLDASNLLNQRWKDGQFVYSSSFGSAGQTRRLPQIHYTAGPPFRLLVTIGLQW